ncbi:MAG: hypothetical protein A2W08_19230 [Candidatus Rokubacteria bacterium RBG_16_73_20]|nr:MAG: hypothetical protein A2W08_19230 [Candidatus Rokubacteria bacterium RBG_16_73_20]HBH02880.1 hypothetical protein [Candidatus Rokubacteria bacterium]
MSTPPLLLGAALAFWGWQTGLVLFGLAVATLLEGARVVTWRLELSRSDFDRVADLCAILFLGGAVYLVATTGVGRTAVAGPRALTILFEWLPLLLAPLIACQAYSVEGRVPLTAFFWALRRRARRDPAAPPGALDLAYPYLALVVLATSAANVRTPAFYVGLTALVGWALWPARSRRFSLACWAALLVAGAALGWGGQAALHRLQTAVEERVFEYLFSLVRRDVDPFRSTTAIGQLGELKLSERIVLRVDPGPGVRVPLLLREASYDLYNSPAWFASAAGFVPIQPEPDGETWRLGGEDRAGRTVAIAAYLARGRGVLTLPNGAYRLDRLAAVSVSRNRLGAVKVDEGLGLVGYGVRFEPAASLDAPPTAADTGVPAREAAVLGRIAAELRLAALPPADAVHAVEDWFRRNFRYSLYRRAAPSDVSPLEQFLLETRAGHCEYFGTATVLLLRAAGIPARYAVGYSVQEWSRLERRYVVRQRHAHAWALVWVGGAWRDVDTTPPVWVDEEASGSLLGPAADLWAWAQYGFARWRWGEGGDWIGPSLGWLLLPLLLLLAWRLRARRRVDRRGPAAPAPAAAPPRPGGDSEFYLVARALAAAGRERRPSEPASAWVERLHEDALRPLVGLHYRYRFDPAGISAGEREALRAAARAWLAEREPAARA